MIRTITSTCLIIVSLAIFFNRGELEKEKLRLRPRIEKLDSLNKLVIVDLHDIADSLDYLATKQDGTVVHLRTLSNIKVKLDTVKSKHKECEVINYELEPFYLRQRIQNYLAFLDGMLLLILISTFGTPINKEDT
jgi:hypothetical protein